MTSQEDLLCMFTTTISESDGEYRITVPSSEIDLGTLDTDEPVRVSVSAQPDTRTTQPGQKTLTNSTQNTRSPPVDEGETRTVIVENIGEKGDGIAKVEKGYVLIVPDTEIGDEVRVRIDRVTPNYAMAEPLKILPESEPETVS